MSAGISSVLPSATYAGPLTEFWANAGAGGGGGSPGVTQIVAGNNITISPGDGEGVVTINATGGGGGGVTSISAVGAGIAVSAPTGVVNLSNTGVTSLIAGAGVTLSGATGDVTVSAPAAAVPVAYSYTPMIGSLGLPALVLGWTKIGRIVTVVGRISGSGTVSIPLPAGALALLPPYSGAGQFVYDSTLTVTNESTSQPGLICGRMSQFGTFEMYFQVASSTGLYTWTYPTSL